MNNQIYFIVIIILIFILPDSLRIQFVITGGILLLGYYMIFSPDFAESMKVSDKVPDINKKIPLHNEEMDEASSNKLEKECNKNIKNTYLQYINELLEEPDNVQAIGRYYEKPKFEEQYADYGLAGKQKELLRHSDKARDSESRMFANKFAPFFGNELDIIHDWAWYGVDY